MPRRVQKYRDEGNIWEEESGYGGRRRQSENTRPKAPLMLRVLTWTGIILLCFVGGYIGTSWGIKLLNREGQLTHSTQEENVLTGNSGQKQDNIDIKMLTVDISYPIDGVLTTVSFDLISGIKEQEIKETIEKLFSSSKMFSKEVVIKNVFCNAATLYLNITGPFIPSLSNAGQETSTLLINGIVKTMKDNFLPISEVRFLINGRVNTAGSPVDLTIAWK